MASSSSSSSSSSSLSTPESLGAPGDLDSLDHFVDFFEDFKSKGPSAYTIEAPEEFIPGTRAEMATKIKHLLDTIGFAVVPLGISTKACLEAEEALEKIAPRNIEFEKAIQSGAILGNGARKTSGLFRVADFLI